MDGLAHKVLQWYLCRMEGWFAADANTISLKCWDQVLHDYSIDNPMISLYFYVGGPYNGHLITMNICFCNLLSLTY